MTIEDCHVCFSKQGIFLVLWLILAVVAAASRRSVPQISHLRITAAMNSSKFSCQSTGQPLASCLWSRTINGLRDETLVDEEIGQAGGFLVTDGISYFGNELEDGKFSIRIESITSEHLGPGLAFCWKKSGDVFHAQT